MSFIDFYCMETYGNISPCIRESDAEIDIEAIVFRDAQMEMGQTTTW